LRKVAIFRTVLFSILVFIDLTTVPYVLSLKEVITDQVYVTDFYGVPQDLKYAYPEDLRAFENDLLGHFRRMYPNDNITSNSFLMGSIYRNDSTTEGYMDKSIPIYDIFIYRTYETLSASGFVALFGIVTLDVLIASMIVLPPYNWKNIFRSHEKIPADFSYV
jgi:hypothetical protein